MRKLYVVPSLLLAIGCNSALSIDDHPFVPEMGGATSSAGGAASGGVSNAGGAPSTGGIASNGGSYAQGGTLNQAGANTSTGGVAGNGLGGTQSSSGGGASGGTANSGGKSNGGSVASGGTSVAVSGLGGTQSSSGGGASGGTANSGGKSNGGSVASGGTSVAVSGLGGTQSSSGGASSGQTSGGASTGGTAATGGANSTGGTKVSTGGAATGGVATGGVATGGAATGSSPPNMTGPCDIYAAASLATPCVAAYSTTRLLSSAYTGKLYQVRVGGSASGSGGTLTDIGTTADGFADGAAQDTACGSSACSISLLYDQSGRGNNLIVAPAGCYTGGNANEPDYESNAKGKSVQISGHKVYALYMIPQDGYRNNSPSGMPTGSAAQGIYEVADGTRTGAAAGTACCWDFGNASTNNCNQGTMSALFFGTGYWGKGTGSGPWFLADFEGGVWAGGTGASNAVNNNLPSSNVAFAFGILKTNSAGYEISVGSAASGSLTIAYSGAAPKTLSNQGGIILGIGGDNSNTSQGTFFEGAITSGRPSDTTDAAILANVQAAKYGQ